MNAQFSAFLDSVRGRRCAVIGMGVSNTPLIRLLLDAGASVLICDKKEDQDEALLSEFRGRGAEFCLGEKYLTQLSGIEIIFKTPGMRYDVPELIEAEKIDENRLALETVIYADKSSVEEEITRLNSHIYQFKELIKQTNVGKKIDFLIQEMNRETNTIGSKSSSIEITNLVIEIKTQIEDIREQIQNVE